MCISNTTLIDALYQSQNPADYDVIDGVHLPRCRLVTTTAPATTTWMKAMTAITETPTTRDNTKK